MTIEQDQPQPQSNQTQSGSGSSQGQGHRRRRRRRKGFASGQATRHASENGQQPVPAKQSHKSKPASNRIADKNGSNGNGLRPQGGGRRRGKLRRQQTFVGPMDHSYRAVNGNMADVSPSTIEFRGNGHPGSYIEPVPTDAVVAPIREGAPTRIYCFIEDLFVLAKIQETARKLGVKVGFVKADKDFITRLMEAPESDRPSLIVFDLNNAGAKPLTLIPRIKNKLKRGTSVIGFLSHLQGDLKAKALEAGCDMVMPRSAFSQNLPTLLRRHGIDEEFEPAEA
jgi:CheY-like chemotaxis protein